MIKGKQKKAGLVPAEPDFRIKEAVDLAKSIALAEHSQHAATPDTVAVERMRTKLNELELFSRQRPDDWTIADIIKVLEIVRDMLDATMSTLSIQSDIIEVVLEHPATSTLASFIGALEDFEGGVLDGRLRKTKEAGGRSLTKADRQKIGLALTFVQIIRRAKKVPITDARKRLSEVLKKSGTRVAGKEMTPERLKEWAKDYDLNGHKKKGN